MRWDSWNIKRCKTLVVGATFKCLFSNPNHKCKDNNNKPNYKWAKTCIFLCFFTLDKYYLHTFPSAGVYKYCSFFLPFERRDSTLIWKARYAHMWHLGRWWLYLSLLVKYNKAILHIIDWLVYFLILECNIEFIIHMVYEVPEQLITKSSDNCRKIWNKKE